MSRSVVSYLRPCAMALWLAPLVAAQLAPGRAAAPAPSATISVQDWSWYAFEQRPPFVSPLHEGQDTRGVISAGAALIVDGELPVIPAALDREAQLGGRFEAGWYLVHFAGGYGRDEQLLLDALTGPVRRGDGSVLSRWYVPNDAAAAWVADPATLRALESAPAVDLVTRYQPAWKLDPTIGTALLTSADRVGRATLQLDLDLMPGHPRSAVVAALRALGVEVLAEVEQRGLQTYDVHFVVVRAKPAQIAAIASIEGVRLVQESGDGLAAHDLSAAGKLQKRALAKDDVLDSPIVNATNYPLWLTHNLQGQGQFIGVVDTSYDWNNVGTAGCNTGYPDTAIDNYGFALPNLSRVLLGTVGAGGVNLKIPRADLLGGATLQGVAADEHGVGVAGAAAGDFYGNNDVKWWEHDPDTWDTWSPSNYSGLLGPGIAHEAQLFLTPVMDSANVFRWESAGEFPTNMGITLTNMANAGVSTTNHSVGLAESANTYTQVSVVHDTKGFDHPYMLQCMAAGNAGAGSNKLTSQAVVKNGLAVGASDDVLKPEDRASFSSTGPVFDGRRKPDVMAPGTDTAPRTGGVQSLLILPDTNGTSAASCAYQYTSGTSFSSPITAGAGALVHQYFQEGRYPGSAPLNDASAALLKAMLVNSGHRLTGLNLGDNLFPNMYQGWGEPVLTDVLDFGTGARRLIVSDVPSAAGFTSSANANDVLSFNVTGSTEMLRVSLAWTDEPGAAGTGKKLINDLDLIVTAPGGATYRGNVFNTTAGTSITGGSADTLNNVENVYLASPAVGAWTATVDPGAGNYSVGQGYALVLTGQIAESGGGPAAPVANFTGTPLSGTAPLLVSFTDTSTGSVSTWSWAFGDGGTSTAQHPQHTYTSPGTYSVTLTATGPGGTDGETKTGYVTVSAPPTGSGLYYLSFTATVTVPGVGSVADEDVVSYDPATGLWALYFDGSDVGLGGTDVNALHVLSDGSLVLSLDSATFTVPGLTGGPSGTTVEDKDLMIFSFTSSGANTAGTFSFVFDGSDVGLTTSNEDIDGIYEFPGGGLALSIIGSGAVTGVSSVQDEDVLLFSATQYGATTAGTWSLHFDGSDVGFSTSADEDICGLAFDGANRMLFSTVGVWSAAGGAGDDEDVGQFDGSFGSTTSGTASLRLDLSALGIATAADVDGLGWVP